MALNQINITTTCLAEDCCKALELKYKDLDEHEFKFKDISMIAGDFTKFFCSQIFNLITFFLFQEALPRLLRFLAYFSTLLRYQPYFTMSQLENILRRHSSYPQPFQTFYSVSAFYQFWASDSFRSEYDFFRIVRQIDCKISDFTWEQENRSGTLKKKANNVLGSIDHFIWYAQNSASTHTLSEILTRGT